MMNNQPPPHMKPPSQILSRDYGVWAPPPPPPPSSGSVPVPVPSPEDSLAFHNAPALPRPIFQAPGPVSGRSNWKPKTGFNKRIDNRRIDKGSSIGGSGAAVGGGGSGYKPPGLQELQSQNRLKARRFYPKKKHNNRFAPFAPRNTTSFIIRAKKSGGIASLVSPCPVTPAVLSTPIFSPSREVFGDMAKEQWGVDGYGSMNGLIRLRSPGHRDDDEDDGGSSESDLEEREEVERRLNHDLSRFEMIYPNWADEQGNHDHVDGDVDDDDQDAHVARLEEENLTLKERLFLMERELLDLRTRLENLETDKLRSKKEEESCSKDNFDEILANERFRVQQETKNANAEDEVVSENEGVGSGTHEEERLENHGGDNEIQGETTTTHDEMMEDENDKFIEEGNGEALGSKDEVVKAKGDNEGKVLKNGSEGSRNLCSESHEGLLE
ncbi:hypothetical protein Scep_003740 [Stephania cephalantha]|uniref:PRLI-interacting factor A n=1 Tax=Stephania cephalantha TaxID=152367 RepID=A0AAP0PYC3_9MAGN